MNGKEYPIYRDYSRIALDREYDARKSVPSFEEEYALYVAASKRARQALTVRSDVVYDAKSGNTLDIYEGPTDAPLFLWIHGGYWRFGSKDDNAFVALGLVPHGISVAVMNYTLAPAASLDEIVRQVRAAVAFLVHEGKSRSGSCKKISVGGSSAGGHLVGMLLAKDWFSAHGVHEDCICSALALSGLFDLDPLRHTHVNEWLFLDTHSAARNSPINLITPDSKTKLIASVGGRETFEFRRQTIDFAAAWRAVGNTCDLVKMPDHNHFNIALSLSDPSSPIVLAAARSVISNLG